MKEIVESLKEIKAGIMKGKADDQIDKLNDLIKLCERKDKVREAMELAVPQNEIIDTGIPCDGMVINADTVTINYYGTME